MIRWVAMKLKLREFLKTFLGDPPDINEFGIALFSMNKLVLLKADNPFAL